MFKALRCRELCSQLVHDIPIFMAALFLSPVTSSINFTKMMMVIMILQPMVSVGQ